MENMRQFPTAATFKGSQLSQLPALLEEQELLNTTENI